MNSYDSSTQFGSLPDYLILKIINLLFAYKDWDYKSVEEYNLDIMTEWLDYELKSATMALDDLKLD